MGFQSGFQRLHRPVPVFDATNSDTYQSTRSATIFDSLGNSHIFQIYFQKSAANTWDTHAAVDGKAIAYLCWYLNAMLRSSF
ncbi:MAG: hypothetical protein IPP22_08430 [Nitrosomonas sp.]|nr:hypothetical protein [Nitrosomonas sp.]